MHDGARAGVPWVPGGRSPGGLFKPFSIAPCGSRGYAPVPSRELTDGFYPQEERGKEVAVGSSSPPGTSAAQELAIRKAEQQAVVFDTYAICSAILTGFSCSASYMSVSDLEAEDIVVFILTNLQQWLVRLCTAMGIYSVLVFTFCAMYSRSCLARPGKLGMEIFTLYMKRTGKVRVRAFYNMYSMALLYCFSVLLSCWISFDHLKASVAAISISVVLTFTVVDTNSIITVAGLIYAPDEVVQDALQELAEEEEQTQKEE